MGGGVVRRAPDDLPPLGRRHHVAGKDSFRPPSVAGEAGGVVDLIQGRGDAADRHVHVGLVAVEVQVPLGVRRLRVTGHEDDVRTRRVGGDGEVDVALPARVETVGLGDDLVDVDLGNAVAIGVEVDLLGRLRQLHRRPVRRGGGVDHGKVGRPVDAAQAHVPLAGRGDQRVGGEPGGGRERRGELERRGGSRARYHAPDRHVCFEDAGVGYRDQLAFVKELPVGDDQFRCALRDGGGQRRAPTGARSRHHGPRAVIVRQVEGSRRQLRVNVECKRGTTPGPHQTGDEKPLGVSGAGVESDPVAHFEGGVGRHGNLVRPGVRRGLEEVHHRREQGGVDGGTAIRWRATD